jgi:hypothetical protein
LSDFDVVYADGVMCPPKPVSFVDDSKKIAEIFASSSAVGNYTKKVEGEIRANENDPDDYEFITIETYDEAIFLPYIGVQIENLDEKIKLGYNKIASEFAILIDPFVRLFLKT